MAETLEGHSPPPPTPPPGMERGTTYKKKKGRESTGFQYEGEQEERLELTLALNLSY